MPGCVRLLACPRGSGSRWPGPGRLALPTEPGYIARPSRGDDMPKQKSHSGAKKRFRFTATGKAKRKFSHKNHILTKKNADRVRRLRGTTLVSEPDQRRIEAMLPHGGK
jgi:large subunit ribosomal protein L35